MTRHRPRPTPRLTPRTLVCALALLCACEAVTPANAAVSTRTVARTDGSPLGDAAPSTDAPWTGVVEQALDAKPYTYLAVREGDALRWVAIMGAARAPGSTVTIRNLALRTDFHSRKLDRTFAELVFGEITDVMR